MLGGVGTKRVLGYIRPRVPGTIITAGAVLIEPRHRQTFVLAVHNSELEYLPNMLIDFTRIFVYK